MSRKSKWKLSSGPEDNSALQLLCEGLLSIEFKPLTRPIYRATHGHNKKELRWALRVFTASSMSFLRDLLRSYLVIRENKLEAASFLVVRAMYETVCGAHYANEQYRSKVGNGNLEEAWEVLSKLAIGSKVLRLERQGKSTDANDYADPVKLWDTINSLDSIDPKGPKGWAYSEYRRLSEFSHPDLVSFSHYHQIDKNPYRASFYKEPEPDQGYLRNKVGFLMMIAGLVYRNLFQAAELHTAQRLLTKLMTEFEEAESKYPKPVPL